MDEHEEEVEETTPERKAAIKELKQRSRELGIDASEILSSDEEKQEYQDRFEKLFKHQGLTFTIGNLKAFQAGFEFGIFMANEKSQAMESIMHLERIRRNAENKLKAKVDPAVK